MPSSFYHNGFQSNIIWIHKFYGGLIGYNLSIYMQVITRLNSIAYKEIFLIDENLNYSKAYKAIFLVGEKISVAGKIFIE